jgi:hypothetical protein
MPHVKRRFAYEKSNENVVYVMGKSSSSRALKQQMLLPEFDSVPIQELLVFMLD